MFLTLLKIVLSLLLAFIQPFMMHAEEAVEDVQKEIIEAHDPFEIILFGDVMMGRYISTLMGRLTEEDPTFPLTHLPEIIDAYSEDPEIVGVNLEGPITDFQISYCDMCFRFPETSGQLLAQQGVTFANLANNHMFNQGENGYEQTKTYLTGSGISYVGHAHEVNEFSSYIQEIEGMRIGWLGFDDIEGRLDYEAATQLTGEIAKQADFTIVAIHWGTEYVNTPSASIQTYAHNFIDAGADMIWGTHPHVIQSIENYGEGMIFYSLGNFVFDQYWSAGTQEGLGVKLTIADEVTYELIPIKLTEPYLGDPYLMDEEGRADMLSRLQDYSEQIGVVVDENMNFAEGVLRSWQ